MQIQISFISTILILLSFYVNAQDYFQSHFTIEDGLPSDYCYNLIQDDEGYIWIAAQSDICIFDGHNFQKDIYPNLAKNEVTKLLKDPYGRIWINSLSGAVFYIENKEIFQYKYPENISNEKRVDVSIDIEGNLWICEDYGFAAIGVDTETLEIKYRFKTFDDHVQFLSSMGVFPKMERVRNDEKNQTYISDGKELTLGLFTVHDFYKNQKKYDDSTSIFYFNDGFYVRDQNKNTVRRILHNFKDIVLTEPNDFDIDRDENLWIVYSERIFLVNNPTSPDAEIREVCSEKNITSIIIDNQNNIWFSTLNKGIIKLSASALHTIKDYNERKTSTVISQNDRIVYTAGSNSIVVLDQSENIISEYYNDDAADYIYDSDSWDEKNILISTKQSLLKLNLEQQTLDTLKYIFNIKSTSVDKDNIWVSTGTTNFLLNKDKLELKEIPPCIRSYCNQPISPSKAYIGTISGLYLTDSEKLSTVQIEPDLIKDYITSLYLDKHSYLWVGTYGNGIYVLKENKLHQHIPKLPSRYVNKIVGAKNAVWVGTNNGVVKITKVNGQLIMKNLSKSDGLFSNEVKDIFLNENQVLVAAGTGLSILDQNIKFDDDIPLLRISTVKINEQDTVTLQNYNLSPDQRNVKISFTGIHFKNPNSVEYKYKMQGVDSDWVVTKQNIAQYPFLAPGTYSFFVKAKSSNSNWSDYQKITFEVPKYFVESNAFKSLLAIMIFILMLLGFIYYHYQIDRRQQFKMSKMTALRAQMNPHFIFNSLNSVQDYILRDNKRAANKYISKFSKLMRYTLNASENEFTNLNLELEALELYLSIESMRFDNTLQYQIKVDQNIDQSQYLIPTMILQPYVENAIKHGLMHASGEKFLHIKVDKKNKGLNFEIIDNGIGRVSSKFINYQLEDKPTSKGTAINQQRIDLLNKSYNAKNTVTFQDIYDNKKNPTGTKVEIFLESFKFIS